MAWGKVGKKTLASFLLLMALGGCHSLFGGGGSKDQDEPKGQRIAVLEKANKPQVDPGLDHFAVELQGGMAVSDWTMPGGNVAHNPANPALAVAPKKIWSSSIGDGSGGDYRLLATPVVAAGRVFTIDARGRVAAFDLSDGDRVWRFDTTPKDRDGRAMGGGLAYADGVLYATTGFGEVLALSARDGRVLWRKGLESPVRAAPTVADGRVLVVRIDNELDALSARDGALLWHHNGMNESAALMGASSPALVGDAVVVTYSSGEIFSLRAQTGRPAWSDILASPAPMGALPSIADIRGLPVVDQGTAYAVSHSDRMAAFDLRTGERRWERDLGSVNTPALGGNVVFVVTNDNELLALARSSGRIVWLRELQKRKDPTDKDSDPVSWYGPVLAGGRLWLTNSMGHLVSFMPDHGDKMVDEALADKFFLPPIAADGMLFALSDGGRLYALK